MSLNDGAIAAIVFAVVVFVLMIASSLSLWYCMSCCVARVSPRPNHPAPPHPYQQVSVKDLTFQVDREKQHAFIETKLRGTRFMRFFTVIGHDCEALSRTLPCETSQRPCHEIVEPCHNLALIVDNGMIVDFSGNNTSSLTGPSPQTHICQGLPGNVSGQEEALPAHPLVINISVCPKCAVPVEPSMHDDPYRLAPTADRYSEGLRGDLECSSSSCNEDSVASHLRELEQELLLLLGQHEQLTKVVARDTLLFNLHTYGHMRLGEQILEARDYEAGGFIPLRGVVVVQSKSIVSLEDIVLLPGDLICVMQFVETELQSTSIDATDTQSQATPDLARSGHALGRLRMTCSGYLLNVCVEQNSQLPPKIIVRAPESISDAPVWVSDIPVGNVSRL